MNKEIRAVFTYSNGRRFGMPLTYLVSLLFKKNSLEFIKHLLKTKAYETHRHPDLDAVSLHWMLTFLKFLG